MMLRPMLQSWGSYTPFVVFSAVVTVISAVFMIAVGRERDA
jgi:hypothetical protein